MLHFALLWNSGATVRSLQSRFSINAIMADTSSCCVHCELLSFFGNLCGGILVSEQHFRNGQAVPIPPRDVAEQTAGAINTLDYRWRQVDFAETIDAGCCGGFDLHVAQFVSPEIAGPFKVCSQIELDPNIE